MFNINKDATKQAKGGNYLAGDAIHNVKLGDVTMETIDTKNGPAKVLRIKVVGVENGAEYTETLFGPTRAEDAERTINANGKPQASNLEHLSNKCVQFIAAFRPKLFAQIESGETQLAAKNWDDFRKILHKELTPAIGKIETQIKLTKNNSGFTETNRFTAGLNKNGDVFTSNWVVGKNLSFSDYEMQQIEKRKNARPSSISSITAGSDDDISLAGSDLDVDINLEELDNL